MPLKQLHPFKAAVDQKIIVFSSSTQSIIVDKMRLRVDGTLKEFLLLLIITQLIAAQNLYSIFDAFMRPFIHRRR